MRNHAGVLVIAVLLIGWVVGGGCSSCGSSPLHDVDAPTGGEPCMPGLPGQCAGGQICSTNHTCTCPPYTSFCNGQCIPTSVDPGNCGGCGVTCTGTLACSAGVCASTCLPGQTPCSNSCTDTKADGANCGMCGRTCGPGTGCVQGMCMPTATVTGPPAGKCTGGGPEVNVTDTQCGSDVAATTFRFALCSCADLDQGTTVLTDAYDSTKGPYMPGGLGGGVGINGNFTLQQTGDVLSSGFTVDVSGSFFATGATGIATQSKFITREELHITGGVLARSRVEVTKNAFIAGDIDANPGPLAVTGKLHQPAGKQRRGTVTFGSSVDEPVVVGEPCECGAKRIPVGVLVAARAASNDNASIGLDPAVLTGATAPQHLRLPCGRYFLNAINVTKDLTIVATGHTALFITGSVQTTAKLQLWLEPAASFDILIAGELIAPNGLDIGSPNYPALSRTYIGGSQMIAVTNNTNIAGNFYAAYAPVRWQSPTEVYGAVYAGTFNGLTDVKIHYDRAVLNTTCPPSSACTDCTDCQNQACLGGKCGMCRSDADCCAPLACDTTMGECVPILQ